ncbi:outer membrane protein assembly factor BamD [Hydrogenimonas cancrithermarum]|uniref:Outer membrane protein assembly factor BamD n=1 Tax=Hydrogenimonas cancrithermarum TaxID=2993563 RepID=A0ABM8FNV7_9BACT|nr:outer membrane protein assembly factor BamD [Hydrogenimonas cancrithermarum]BDY13507.1 outer membrane protein assembly factor BamD [Hydrogenimonas cancrithermarum]
MYRIALHAALAVMLTLAVGGCGSKNKEEYEKPALYWYQKMMKSAAAGNLEKADDYFTSLESEHIGSPLIPQAMIILMQAHMDNEEYLLANFYLDEYMKRYGSFKNRQFAEFIQIKAAFYGLKSPQRDQKLVSDTLKKARGYIAKYTKGEYTPMVETIEVRLEMTQYLMNESIASLYERRNKPKAAQIYRARNERSWLKKEDIVPPAKGWLGWLFD